MSGWTVIRRTGQLDRLHEVVEHEFREDGEAIVVLEEGEFWPGRVDRVRSLGRSG